MNRIAETKEARKAAAGQGRDSDLYERTPFGRRPKSKNTGRIKSAIWLVFCAPSIYLWTHLRRGMSRLAHH